MLRGGLIGCGFFARNHLYAWGDVEGAEIVAVCDRDADKAASAAATFGIPRHYRDGGAMLEGEALDFVDIVTTMESHRGLVELTAHHRLPTICQKPFAPTLDDARAMVAACETAGVPLMVHENFRWQTPLRAVRDVVDSGAIGAPFFGRVSFRTGYDVYAGQPYLATVERFALLDMGVHLLDVARWLMGEVGRLSCRTASVKPGIAGEDAATILCGHVDGGASIVDMSYATRAEPDAFPQTIVEIDGAAGSIRLSPGYAMTVSTADGSETSDVAPGCPAWAEPPWHLAQESVVRIQQHWVDCLRAGREPATSGRDNLKTLALVEAAYASAASGDAVVPERIGP